MFENNQDTLLLHSALESALYAVKNVEENFTVELDDFLNLSDEDLASVVSTVSCRIKSIMRLSTQFVLGQKIVQAELERCRRIHAVLFYMALRSNGIISHDADVFYEAVNGLFPLISWKLYFKVIVDCKWSKYFIECVMQLPADIFIIVMNELFLMLNCIENKNYAWHMVLQAVIYMPFDTKIGIISGENKVPFNFDFVYKADVQHSIKDEATSEGFCSVEQENVQMPEDKLGECSSNVASDSVKSKLDNKKTTELHNHIYHLMHNALSENLNYEFLKVIFSGIMRLFSYFNFEPVEPAFATLIIKNFNLITFFDKLDLEPWKATFKAKFEDFSFSQSFPCSTKNLWDIPDAYLSFLLFHNWKKFFKNISNFEDYEEQLLPIDKIIEGIYLLNPLSNLSHCTSDYIQMLLCIIDVGLEGQEYALNNVLQVASLLERDNIVSCLIKNHNVITENQLYYLSESITKMENTEAKEKCLKLFIDAFSSHDLQFQNKLLHHICNTYGCGETFKTRSFAQDLFVFLNRTTSTEQVKQSIGKLCIQSPKAVLCGIIESGIRNGDQCRFLMQGLKCFPIMYSYQCPETKLQMIAEVLQLYFGQRNLSTVEKQNIIWLFRYLMEEFYKNNENKSQILPYDVLLKACILPNLNRCAPKVELSLECLAVIMHILEDDASLDLDIETITVLIALLVQLIDNCVSIRDGHFKEEIVNILLVLEKFQQRGGIALDDFSKNWLAQIASSLHPVVSYYILKFLPMEIDLIELPLPYLWCFYCLTNDTDVAFFESKARTRSVSYSELVCYMSLLLSHFTSKEWVKSIDLLQRLFKFVEPENHVQHDKEWSFTESEVECLNVFRCVLDCVHVIITGGVANESYIINCFSSVLKSLLKRELGKPALTTMLLEVCNTATSLSPDFTIQFRAMLFSLRRAITDSKDDSSKKNCSQCLELGLTFFPKFSDL